MVPVIHRKQRPGYLLLEALLGMAIFSIFMSALGMTLLYGQENTVNAGDRTRGVYLASRTMEGVRAIRDGSFSSVTTGTKGVWVNPATHRWAFSGTSMTLSGSYVTSVTISSKASDWLAFTGTTSWKHGYNRAGVITLTGEVTDWRSAKSVGNWGTPTLEGSLAPGGTPLFNKLAIAGNVAYVTCNATTGLYMINIANTATPARLNSAFSIGYSAYDVVIRGKRMYVLTSDSNAELKVYSITNPSVPTLVTSYNLPGNGLGTSLATGFYDLYVTATYSATAGQYELYAFDISNSGSVVLTSGINDTATMHAIALSGTSAYIGSAQDTGELTVMYTSATGAITANGTFNLTDRTLNGIAIAVSGTSAILGTEKGTSISEMALFSVGSGVPSALPGPWYHETSGSLLDVDMDPYRCYTFVAVSSGRKAFQVVNMRNKTTLPELYSYNSSTGLGRGLTYDAVRDRVFVTTDSAILIFSPAASGGNCP